MKQDHELTSKDKQLTKLEPELFPSEQDQQASSSCKQRYRIQQSSNMLERFKQNFNCNFQNNLENPISLIFQLIMKLQQAYLKIKSISNKYTELQIQMYNLTQKIPASISEKIKEDIQNCLAYHNIWASRNDLILINPQSKKGCSVQNNKLYCTKKKHDKFMNSFGILNKTPDNCSLEIKLELNNLDQQIKLQKDDYIRLKLFPAKVQSEPSNQLDPVRCITLDQGCIEKMFCNGDVIKFKIDLFSKKAKAYYNEEMVKFNDDIKMRKLQTKGQKFIPTIQFNFGAKNTIRSFQINMSLDFIYKDI